MTRLALGSTFWSRGGNALQFSFSSDANAHIPRPFAVDVRNVRREFKIWSLSWWSCLLIIRIPIDTMFRQDSGEYWPRYSWLLTLTDLRQG